jgi:hypothetical protein
LSKNFIIEGLSDMDETWDAVPLSEIGNRRYQAPLPEALSNGNIGPAPGTATSTSAQQGESLADILSDRAAQHAMTHQAEEPNPAQPYLNDVRNFAGGGISGVLQGRGVELPGWMNSLNDVLHDPDVNLAMGMAGRYTMTPAALAARAKGGASGAGARATQAKSIWGNPDNMDRLRDLKAKGYSDSEIAAELGVSRSAVISKWFDTRTNEGIPASRAFRGRRGTADQSMSAPGVPSLPQLKSMAQPAEDIDPAELKQFLQIFGDR